MSLKPLPRMMAPATSALAWNAFCNVVASTGQPPVGAALDLPGAALDGAAALDVPAAGAAPDVAPAAAGLVSAGSSEEQPARAIATTTIGSSARVFTRGILASAAPAWLSTSGHLHWTDGGCVTRPDP